MSCTRRQFLDEALSLAALLSLGPAGCPPAEGAAAEASGAGWKEAEYYRKNPDGSVNCLLCPHRERLLPGQTGQCRTRTNVRGVLKTAATGRPCVVNQDPVEKNPLAHFLPGAKMLALAHAGCNLRCRYCQNWAFAMERPEAVRQIAFSQGEALALARDKGLAGLTFTYTEGTTHIEFNRAFAAAARRAGLRTALATNGFVEEAPMAAFLDHLDAVTVTIKGFTPKFYREIVGAPSLEPVLACCRQVRKSGRWLEIATLVLPGINDSDAELGGIARWVKQELGADTPWHLERFTPMYRMTDHPQTPVAVLERARDLGLREGLRFVYISNLAPHAGNHTYCPTCGLQLVTRLGFQLLGNRLRHGRCPTCSTQIPGVWSAADTPASPG